ncbi:MAG: tyrosine-type recombinase/integrase [Pseudomonadota bacterium]|nr:tyrosine-type recombinase/integrase [Pseudomonadota bacterium]
MTDNNSQMLGAAIGDYRLWMIANGYNPHTRQCYERIVNNFLTFVSRREIAWDDMFTLETLKAFQKHDRRKDAETAIRGLCRYLYKQGKIRAPIPRSRHRKELPEIYEDYLAYRQKRRQVSDCQIALIKRVLSAFDDYLKRHNIKLSTIKIGQLDAFLAEFTPRFAPATCRVYRSHLRGFLRYLHHERGMLASDLARLLVGARVYAKAKPPHFLRPHQLQALFASLKFSTASELRTSTMIHLAYTLGLRPIEISKITLDDISFTKAELLLKTRKNNNPIKLPLPEQTLKVIAAYIVGGRPESSHRTLFLSVNAPYGPISSAVVVHHIRKVMKAAKLPATAYWLRHTYAQNLLEAGASIYEVKEMLGHDTIESTQRYLHIHIQLMRKVLFDETL